MSNAVATTSDDVAALVEKVIIQGDLSVLTAGERINYYNEVCRSVGLNPLTKPFDYLKLNNKLTLYALKACTDQLRYIHKISVEGLTNTTVEGVYIVTAKVKNAEGRTDVDDGAVNIGGIKGEALANAVMKAATKAKRRATLSICGLGLLDETEISSIPGAVTGESAVTSAPMPSAPALSPPSPPSPPKAKPAEVSQYYLPMVTDKDRPMYVQWGGELIKYIMAAPNEKQVRDILEANADILKQCEEAAPKAFGSIHKAVEKRDAELSEARAKGNDNNTLEEWLSELDACTSEAAVDDLMQRAWPNIFPIDRTDFKAKCQAKSISLF